MYSNSFDTLQEQVLLNVVDLVLVLAKDDDRGWRLLQALEEIHHFRFLLDVLDHLQDIQVRCAGTADVHEDRLDERLLGKVLDLAWHGSRKEQSLPLLLEHHISRIPRQSQSPT